MKIKNGAFRACLLMAACLLFVSVSLAAVPDKSQTQINLNTATEKELTTLPGIGTATAKSIIAARPFKTVEDLEKVKGIGKTKYDVVKDRVTVQTVAATQPGTATAGKAGAATKPSPVNINTADLKTLEKLPGIGTATAKNIVAARPFKNVEDLEKVKGVGKAKYDAIKDKVTIKTVAAPQPATATTETTGSAAKASLVNINTADLKTLENLPGVGTATAKNIVAARPFKKVEDLEKVKGIGKAKFASLKDRVTVATERAGTTPVSKVPVTAVESAKKGITTPQSSGLEPGKALPTGAVNINTADLKTLEALPGIGPVKAQAIIDHRPYTKVEDIMKVPGIKEGIFSKIKDQIVVK